MFKNNFPDTAEDQFFNGRQWQREIARIREDGYPGNSITQKKYIVQTELWEWWSLTDPKTQQQVNMLDYEAHNDALVWWIKESQQQKVNVL